MLVILSATEYAIQIFTKNLSLCFLRQIHIGEMGDGTLDFCSIVIRKIKAENRGSVAGLPDQIVNSFVAQVPGTIGFGIEYAGQAGIDARFTAS